MNPRYYDFEEVAMLSGIDAQLAQLSLPPPEGENPDFPTGGTGERVPEENPDFPTGGTGERVPEGTMLPTGWPAAVDVVPGAWNLSADPATYIIQAGDTLAGLAATYLGDPARWQQIWNMQPQSFRFSHSPDVIFSGQVFLMPQEAADNMRTFLAAGSPEGSTPGSLTPSQQTIGKLKSAIPWVIGGVLVVGGGMLLLRRRG